MTLERVVDWVAIGVFVAKAGPLIARAVTSHVDSAMLARVGSFVGRIIISHADPAVVATWIR